MAFGLGQLRLSPSEFWAMTPRELAAAADLFGAAPHAPPSRDALDELMRCYPDQDHCHE